MGATNGTAAAGREAANGTKPIDLYRVLRLRRTATKDEVAKAFRRLSLKHHPDRNPGDPKAAERFHRILLAYDVLSDDIRRARYDSTGEYDGKKTPTGGNESESLAEIAEVLGAMLTVVVKEVLGHNRNPAREDMVGHVRTVLANSKANVDKQRAALRKARDVLVVAADRFMVTAGENLLASVARVHIGQIDLELRPLDEEARRIDAAVVFLEKSKYRTDAIQQLMALGPATNSAGVIGIWFHQQ